MYRSLLMAGVGVMLAASVGCGGKAHSPDEKYFLVAANVKVPYWQEVNAGFEKAAAELGVKAEMAGPDGYDVKAERDALTDVLKQKPSGILVSASDPAIAAEIDAAIAQNVPVITVDSDAPESKRLTFIGTDNYKAGMLGGRVLAKQLKFRGAVVVYTMGQQENLTQRLKGYNDSFAEYPQIKVTEVVDTKGDERVVYDHTTSLIEKGTRVDGIVCLVSFAAPEVADVLTKKNATGKIAVIGMDTDDRTLAAVQKGVLLATVGQKPYTMAFVGLRMLDELHHHPPASLNVNWANDSFSPVPTFVDTGVSMIDGNNVNRFIDERNAKVKK